MKRILITLAAVVLACSTADAQSLKDILKSTASGVLNSVTEAVSNLDITANPWIYTGVGVELKGDKALSNIAGTAAIGAVESKIDEELAKVGIKSGMMVFNFATDGTFTMKMNNKTFNGTYTTEGQNIDLTFGKVLKSFKMSGKVTATTKGCKMVFQSNKFLSFIKAVLKIAGSKSSSASTISSLLENYDNMMLGFNLTK